MGQRLDQVPESQLSERSFIKDGDEDQTPLTKQSPFMKDSEMIETTFWSNCVTAANYVWSDMQRKQRAFGIGVFTIFLTVSCVTMLKSVVDILPIAFLKLG